MDKTLEEILKRLERIDQTLKGELQGGYTSIPPTTTETAIALRRKNQNCKGANCVPGCGSQYNYAAGCSGA